MTHVSTNFRRSCSLGNGDLSSIQTRDGFVFVGYPRITRPGQRLQFANLKIAIDMFIYPLNTVIFDSYVSLPEGIEFDGSDNLLPQQKMQSIGFEFGSGEKKRTQFSPHQLDGGSSEVREQLKKYVMWLVDVRPSGMWKSLARKLAFKLSSIHNRLFSLVSFWRAACDSEISPKKRQPQKGNVVAWCCYQVFLE